MQYTTVLWLGGKSAVIMYDRAVVKHEVGNDQPRMAHAMRFHFT